MNLYEELLEKLQQKEDKIVELLNKIQWYQWKLEQAEIEKRYYEVNCSIPNTEIYYIN